MPKKKPMPTLPNVSKELGRFVSDVEALSEYVTSASVYGKLPERTQKRLEALVAKAENRSYSLTEIFHRATGIED